MGFLLKNVIPDQLNGLSAGLNSMLRSVALANIIFPGMSWPFCFMLGFCIADVSPAVTTPILLDLNIQKRGTKKGVPTILLAAGSVNSVMAIVFYKIVEEFAWTGSISPENIISIVGIK